VEREEGGQAGGRRDGEGGRRVAALGHGGDAGHRAGALWRMLRHPLELR
jgi:hypothetical protein